MSPPSSECSKSVKVTAQAAACFLQSFFMRHAVLDLHEVVSALLGVTQLQLRSSARLLVHELRIRDLDIF